jgi:DNA repair protein RecO (recombination protein O)
VIEKVEGIVLRSIKFSDNSLIIHLYTRERGRISCMVKKARSKRTGFAPSFFHPFNFLNVEVYYNPNKEIHTLKEVNLEQSFSGFSNDSSRIAVIMFLSEVLNKCIRYQYTDKQLYDFLKNMIFRFNEDTHSSANFHLFFMIELSKFLGFYPVNNFNVSENYFDLLNAQFVSRSSGSQTMDKETSVILSKFMNLTSGNWWEIPLNGESRRKMIDSLLNYYTLHTGTTMDIKSLDVFAEVFS